jgi:hypothetical protein
MKCSRAGNVRSDHSLAGQTERKAVARDECCSSTYRRYILWQLSLQPSFPEGHNLPAFLEL